MGEMNEKNGWCGVTKVAEETQWSDIANENHVTEPHCALLSGMS